MGQIINGKYYPENKAKALDTSTSVFKQSDHDRQRKDHARDLVQPYKGGQVNPEFLEAYPLESKETYKFLPGDEEIRHEQDKK